MIKALYTTDAHFTERQPKNRTDIMVDSLLAKFEFIGRYLENNPDIINWYDGGDLFDKSVQTTRLVNRLMKVFKAFKRQDIFPIKCIPGNHLIKGNNILSVEQSGLQILQEAGYVTIFTDPHIETNHDRTILLHHHAIVKEEVFWDHLTYEQVADANSCDTCLCSHNHTPHPVETVKNTMFIAPGSLSRGTGTEKNLKRPPQFAVFNLEGKKHCEYVTCQETVTYPFIDKAESKNMEEATSELIGNIKKTMEGYDSKSLGFQEVSTLLKKKDIISNESYNYLQGVYEEVK